jgi:hypothetical protein
MDKRVSILEFLKQRIQFTNFHGVSVLLLNDNSVHVGCPFPGFHPSKGISLEITRLYENHPAFLASLSVCSKIELNAITPKDMLRMFENGDMELSCFIERGGLSKVLIFRHEGDSVIVWEDDKNDYAVIHNDLSLATDYIAYSLSFFRFQ